MLHLKHQIKISNWYQNSISQSDAILHELIEVIQIIPKFRWHYNWWIELNQPNGTQNV